MFNLFLGISLDEVYAKQVSRDKSPSMNGRFPVLS